MLIYEVPKRIYCWIDRNILGLGREIVVSKSSGHTVYLPLALKDYSSRAFQQ